MSGLIPDLASWALRGQQRQDDEQDQADRAAAAASTEAPLSEEEIRARRLARMGAPAPVAADMIKDKDKIEQEETASNKYTDGASEETGPSPMLMEIDTLAAASATKTVATPLSSEAHQPVAKKKKSSILDPSRKLQKKKQLLVKKVLLINVVAENTAGTPTSTADRCVTIAVDSSEDITVQTIAELLASRLAMRFKAQPSLLAYLAACHKRAAEELKALSSNNKTPELQELLAEIQSQSVSYAASVLLVPDLFEGAKDSTKQLAQCLLNGATDLADSITLGGSSSFYYAVCEELIQQEGLESVVQEVVQDLADRLRKAKTVLDTTGDASALVITSALAAVCSHKTAALHLTKISSFLLPSPGTPAAQERITPPPPTLPPNATPQQRQFFRLMQAMNRNQQGYLKRSGPALENETLLGLVLRVGIPRDDPSVTSAFPSIAAPLDNVEATASQMRRQLSMYQEACHSLIRSLVTAGSDTRNSVLKWVEDGLRVNEGASAMRPDSSKVSQMPLLVNLYGAVLLKLCEPFLENDAKTRLIDPTFVTAGPHGGVFEEVSRLGENTSQDVERQYNPKNAFIPHCFFFCARSLTLSLVPLTAFYLNLLRNIHHVHDRIRSSNGDLAQDPHFSHLIGMQRAVEVTLFLPETISNTIRFCNTMAGFLVQLDPPQLASMPEHFVDDVCEIMLFLAKVARIQPKLLQGHEYGKIFRMAVKLLSPDFAHLVRNYNLRAKLGDVLHDIFLPSDLNENKYLPAVVCIDPLAGGQTYLLSDAAAQETLAPSLLLLYGEVEHTGFYEKMGHRANIASLLKYLWESSEHHPAFRRITANKDSFIKFANGIMNETNSLIASVMEKLPEIRQAQLQRADAQQWAALSEEEREQILSRLEDNEQNVRGALPLCNKTLQMLGYLNTDSDIRNLFLLQEMCTRLVNMLLHVLTKLVGSKGLELKVENPEEYNFRPKEMLRDLCAIFALFARSPEFQIECAKSGYYNSELVQKSARTCKKLNLLTGESMDAFSELLEHVEAAAKSVARDDALLADAPEEFLDPLVLTFMKDPVILPTSGKVVDRATIAQILLNDPHDPFNRKDLTIEMVEPATDLKDRMAAWLEEKRAGRDTVMEEG